MQKLHTARVIWDTVLMTSCNFTRDIPEGKWVPKDLLAPVSAKPPAKRAKPPPKGAVQSIPVESGEHVQEFKVKWSRTKKLYTEPAKE